MTNFNQNTPRVAYPANERQRRGYCARFLKALFASNAIERIGKDAFLLLSFVAATEDKLHYRESPMFWRDQLMSHLAIHSNKGIIAARNAAISAGLLHFEEGSRTRAARYWTVTPDWLLTHFPSDWKNASETDATRSNTEHVSSDEFQIGTRKGTRKGTHSIPSTQKPISSTPSMDISFDESFSLLVEKMADAIQRKTGRKISKSDWTALTQTAHVGIEQAGVAEVERWIDNGLNAESLKVGYFITCAKSTAEVDGENYDRLKRAAPAVPFNPPPMATPPSRPVAGNLEFESARRKVILEARKTGRQLSDLEADTAARASLQKRGAG